MAAVLRARRSDDSRFGIWSEVSAAAWAVDRMANWAVLSAFSEAEVIDDSCVVVSAATWAVVSEAIWSEVSAENWSLFRPRMPAVLMARRSADSRCGIWSLVRAPTCAVDSAA